MTHLRQMMLDELQRRNYSQSTVRSYIRVTEDFSKHFHRSPDRLGRDHKRAGIRNRVAHAKIGDTALYVLTSVFNSRQERWGPGAGNFRICRDPLVKGPLSQSDLKSLHECAEHI